MNHDVIQFSTKHLSINDSGHAKTAISKQPTDGRLVYDNLIASTQTTTQILLSRFRRLKRLRKGWYGA